VSATVEIYVRPARPGDAGVIAEMSRAVQERLTASGSLQEFGPIPEATIAAHIAAQTAHVLADGGAVLGSVFVECEKARVTPNLAAIFGTLEIPHSVAPRWWLQKLMIVPERQGGRLGLMLLDGVKRHVMARGGATIVLDCWAGNAKLRDFYARAGFQLHGEFRAEGGYDVAAFLFP
jgi:hypothetical protein